MSARRVKGLIRVGQVWRHRKDGTFVNIRQCWRKDLIAKVLVATAEGPVEKNMYFSDLGKDYVLL